MMKPTDHTTDEAYMGSTLLREAFAGRSEGASVANALHVSQQNFAEWLSDNRRNPLCAVYILVTKMREFGNPAADYVFTTLARWLGFTAYRSSEAVSSDAELAGVLREVSDVIAVRAAAEADGEITAAECLNIARESDEAGQKLFAYRDRFLHRAEELTRVSNVRSIR
jgi:hypothetical protein